MVLNTQRNTYLKLKGTLKKFEKASFRVNKVETKLTLDEYVISKGQIIFRHTKVFEISRAHCTYLCSVELHSENNVELRYCHFKNNDWKRKKCPHFKDFQIFGDPDFRGPTCYRRNILQVLRRSRISLHCTVSTISVVNTKGGETKGAERESSLLDSPSTGDSL